KAFVTSTSGTLSAMSVPPADDTSRIREPRVPPPVRPGRGDRRRPEDVVPRPRAPVRDPFRAAMAALRSPGHTRPRHPHPPSRPPQPTPPAPPPARPPTPLLRPPPPPTAPSPPPPLPVRRPQRAIPPQLPHLPRMIHARVPVEALVRPLPQPPQHPHVPRL